MSFADQPTLERARYLYQLRRYAAAIKTTLEYLARYPECSEAYCLLALCYGKEKRENESIEAAQAAVRYNPDLSYPYYVLSVVLNWFDRNHSSLRALAEALRLNPLNPDYYELLASIHHQDGVYQTARECAKKGLCIDPEHAGCLYWQGVSLFAEKQLNKAEAVFRDALRIDPEHAGCQGHLGYIENSRGNFEIALPLLSHALREYPDWKFLQEAWKQALQGSRPVYGIVARWTKAIDNVTYWPFFALLYLCVSGLIFWFFLQSREFNYRLVIGSLVLGAIASILATIVIGMVLHAYLYLVSVVLHYRMRELRYEISFKKWLFQDAKRFLPVYFILSILLIGLIKKLLER